MEGNFRRIREKYINDADSQCANHQSARNVLAGIFGFFGQSSGILPSDERIYRQRKTEPDAGQATREIRWQERRPAKRPAIDHQHHESADQQKAKFEVEKNRSPNG